MFPPSHCDKCGGEIQGRIPWRLVEYTIQPEPIEERGQAAHYHAQCYESWNTVPYVVDGQPCELYKRCAEPRCECCLKTIDTTELHGTITVSQIMEGLQLAKTTLGMFCTQGEVDRMVSALPRVALPRCRRGAS
ncbi:MAG: hypothetical protein K8T91_15545 [Planctomycetes bacterium]|nr:hypothetical protein [Planctomycetota bacterium]